MLEKIDHIGIAVKDLESSIKIYEEALGLKVKMIEEVEEFKVKIAFLPIGEVMIELLEPLDPKGLLADFIRKRGEGLHHIAYRVNDIEAALAKMKSVGIKLRDEKPRIGGAGAKVAFIEPESINNVLVELVERKKEIE